jgi:CcmD family protein
MQQFWHVFIAYAVAWGLVFGWAVAIFRRMGRVEERLRDGGLDTDPDAGPHSGPHPGVDANGPASRTLP